LLNGCSQEINVHEVSNNSLRGKENKLIVGKAEIYASNNKKQFAWQIPFVVYYTKLKVSK
jgi:hypothetical protein